MVMTTEMKILQSELRRLNGVVQKEIITGRDPIEIVLFTKIRGEMIALYNAIDDYLESVTLKMEKSVGDYLDATETK